MQTPPEKPQLDCNRCEDIKSFSLLGEDKVSYDKCFSLVDDRFYPVSYQHLIQLISSECAGGDEPQESPVLGDDNLSPLTDLNLRPTDDHLNHLPLYDGRLSNGGVGGLSPVYVQYRQHETQHCGGAPPQPRGDASLPWGNDSYRIGSLIDSIRASSKRVKDAYGGLPPLHAVFDVVFVSHDFVLSEPTKEFNRMMRDVLGYEINSKFLGWKEIICQDTKRRKSVFIPQYDLKSMPSFSPLKKYLSRKNSVNRTVKMLMNVEGFDYVWHLCLTLPDRPIGIEEFRNMINKFKKRVEEELFNGDELGGHYNIHTWSSREPMNEHLHAHLLIPNVVYNKKLGKLVRVKPYWDKKRLEALKRIWKEISGADDLHISYARKKDYARLTHFYKYASRHVLVDFAYYYAEHSYNPVDREKIKKQIEYENRRVAFGWCRKLKDFVKEKVDDEDRCPICGGRVVVKEEIVKELPNTCVIVFFDWKDRSLKYYSPFFGGGGCEE